LRKLPLYRRKPINPVSDREKVRRRSRSQVYAIVAKRAKGVCEMPGCFARQDPLAPHHAFGRGTKADISTDLCETPEAILGICDECHRKAHDGHDYLLEIAGMTAMRRLSALTGRRPHDLSTDTIGPVEYARLLTRWAKETGFEFNSV
jgi:hypothetical protein